MKTIEMHMPVGMATANECPKQTLLLLLNMSSATSLRMTALLQMPLFVLVRLLSTAIKGLVEG